LTHENVNIQNISGRTHVELKKDTLDEKSVVKGQLSFSKCQSFCLYI